MSKDKPSPFLTIRIDPKLKSQFRAAAQAKDDTPNQVVRRFIRDYVAKSKPTATAGR